MAPEIKEAILLRTMYHYMTLYIPYMYAYIYIYRVVYTYIFSLPAYLHGPLGFESRRTGDGPSAGSGFGRPSRRPPSLRVGEFVIIVVITVQTLGRVWVGLTFQNGVGRVQGAVQHLGLTGSGSWLWAHG